MSPIERAARALAENLKKQAEAHGFAASDAGRYPVLDGCFDMEEATRAVLQAIREPSENMTVDGGLAGEIPVRLARDTWQAMVDAALEEGKMP